MKRRRKDKEAIENKIKSKINLKNKRKEREVIHAPEKYIK
jgi:large subunit ribosomal protein L7e